MVLAGHSEQGSPPRPQAGDIRLPRLPSEVGIGVPYVLI